MGLKLIDWAYDQEDLNTNQKSILVALCRHANEKNDNLAWPSIARLSTICSTCRRSTISALNVLKEKNLIKLVETRRHKSCVYRINNNQTLPKESKPKHNTEQESPLLGVHHMHGGGAPRALVEFDDLTILNRSRIKKIIKKSFDNERDGENMDSTKTEQCLQSGFLKFWNLYPKKVGKLKCYEIWKRKNFTQSDVDTIIIELHNQIFMRQVVRELDCWLPDWKHPSTWLTQECWNDETATDVWEIKEMYNFKPKDKNHENETNFKLTKLSLTAPKIIEGRQRYQKDKIV